MLDKFSKHFPAISLLAAAVAISSVAHAGPVHMKCSGEMLLPNGSVDTNHVLSLTIDIIAKTVKVAGYEPLVILPEIPASPKSIIPAENDEVSFMGKTILGGWLHGSVDRITGEARVVFWDDTPEKEFFSGICKPARS